MTDNSIGPFGWFSAAGFVILSLLYIVDVQGIAEWPVSVTITGATAILAGIGATLLWAGNDPTSSEPHRATRTD